MIVSLVMTDHPSWLSAGDATLDAIVPTTWTPSATTELLDLIHVLGRLVALEQPDLFSTD
ncbi:hypothetical protein ACQPZF_05815 [Actinosynnema sp. CS-041913]|uniref:hypothetical protein n=1 Tax=Actinosynnema sp. CS-041913 TaxID=3239917 RepID=UPI003D9472F3